MNRRDTVIALFALSTGPFAVAQDAKRIPRVGVLVGGNREPFESTFRDGLRKLGYIDGRNIHLEYRSSGGNPDLLHKLAMELVRSKVDIIVAAPTPAAHAAKAASKTIPIVIGAGDPVGTGLVASLARPGGNVTGLSAATAELGGKLLQLVREVLPTTKRVAILATAGDPFTKPFLDALWDGGKSLGIETPSLVVGASDDFESAFAQLTRKRVDAVIVQPSLPRKPVIALAMRHRLPSASPIGTFVDDGGLLSYSTKLEDMYRAMGGYVDKILKGANPADLPVEQVSTHELVVNLKTAKALGITIPQSVILRADRVIE